MSPSHLRNPYAEKHRPKQFPIFLSKNHYTNGVKHAQFCQLKSPDADFLDLGYPGDPSIQIKPTLGPQDYLDLKSM